MTLDFAFLTWQVLFDFVSKGLIFSFQLTLVAMIGGIALGTVLALMRLSGKKWLEVPAAAYVNLLRSVPLVMVILWFFLLIPLLTGRPMGAELSAIITFTVFEAAYYSEIMRAGIQSVPKGQVYAGYAVGMTYKQCMQLIVLPPTTCSRASRWRARTSTGRSRPTWSPRSCTSSSASRCRCWCVGCRKRSRSSVELPRIPP